MCYTKRKREQMFGFLQKSWQCSLAKAGKRSMISPSQAAKSFLKRGDFFGKLYEDGVVRVSVVIDGGEGL